MRIGWTPRELRALLGMRDYTDPHVRRSRSRMFDLIENLYQLRISGSKSRLLAEYEDLDPSRTDLSSYIEAPMGFMPDLEKHLKLAEFERIWPADLEEAMRTKGEAATNFKIDFSIYRSWTMWAQNASDTRTYSMVVLLYEYKQQSGIGIPIFGNDLPSGLHIRLYRDIMRNDIESLFPTRQPRMRNSDWGKLVISSAIGLLTLLPTIFAGVIGIDQPLGNLSGVAGIGALLYSFTVWRAYRRTERTHVAKVVMDLAAKNIANDAAAIGALLERAFSQEVGETILAYNFTRNAKGYPNQLALDKAVEAWFEEMNAPIDFDARGAVEKLDYLGLLLKSKGSNEIQVIEEDEAIPILESTIANHLKLVARKTLSQSEPQVVDLDQ